MTNPEAFTQVEWCLRDLAANLMRVSRGAGKPHEILLQIDEFQKAMAAHKGTVGHFPSPKDLAYAISLGRLLGKQSSEVSEIIYGSLQVAASSLTDQSTFEHAGLAQIQRGMRNTSE